MTGTPHRQPLGTRWAGAALLILLHAAPAALLIVHLAGR